MYKMVEVDFLEQKYYLNYSIEIMFAMSEKFNNISAALDTINLENKSGYEAVKWFFVNMANDGELCRRAMGYDHSKMLTMGDVSMRISPFDFQEIKRAVVEAIIKGYQRKSDENAEVDLGLTELESKKVQARI